MLALEWREIGAVVVLTGGVVTALGKFWRLWKRGGRFAHNKFERAVHEVVLPAIEASAAQTQVHADGQRDALAAQIEGLRVENTEQHEANGKRLVESEDRIMDAITTSHQKGAELAVEVARAVVAAHVAELHQIKSVRKPVRKPTRKAS